MCYLLESAHKVSCESRVLLKTDCGYPRDAGVLFRSRWQTLGVPFALTHIGQCSLWQPTISVCREKHDVFTFTPKNMMCIAFNISRVTFRWRASRREQERDPEESKRGSLRSLRQERETHMASTKHIKQQSLLCHVPATTKKRFNISCRHDCSGSLSLCFVLNPKKERKNKFPNVSSCFFWRGIHYV